ncbi:MAG TPA: putative Ig domain-containing protein [Rhodanobacteraceae bacterium]
MQNINGYRAASQKRRRPGRSPRHLVTWLLLVLLALLLSPPALATSTPGQPSTECGPNLSWPDANSTPSTTPMASGGTIVVDLSACDPTDFGLAGIYTQPSHGTATFDDYNTITYTNNGDGATTDTLVFGDEDAGIVSVTIHIAAATATISVSPVTLPTPTDGVPYSQTLSATGGTEPYSYSIASGALPLGLALSGDTITGTPSTAANYTVGIKVTDSTGTSTIKSYSGTIPQPHPAITTSLPDPVRGVYYSQQLQTSGGLAPFQYSFDSGSGPLPAGLTLSPSGLISGTPTASGSSTFRIQTLDSSSGVPIYGGPYAGVKSFTITVQNPPPLTLGPASLSAAQAGAAYNQTVTASGGVAPYSYAITTGALPAGLTLDASTGAITGTPTAVGTFNFTIQATDSNSTGAVTGAKTYTLTVAAPTISVAPATLPDGTTGTAYSQTLSASGGTGSYTFSVTAGRLPSGVSLSAGGLLSGTPSDAGDFSFTVGATDQTTGSGAPFSGSRAYTLHVASGAPTITTASLPAGTVASTYSTTIKATGGTPGYTFNVTGGSLPAGLSLASNGSLSGTPSEAGTFQIVVEVTDANSQAASRGLSLTIAAPTVTLSPASLPEPVLNVPYNQSVSAAGGVAPYTYAISAGSLPAGLSFDTATGVISGAPTTAGAYSFTIQATGSATGTGAPFSASQTYSGTVSAPTITLSPTTLPAATAGVAVSQVISANGGMGSYSYTLSVGSLPAGVTLSGTGTLSGTPTAVGSFSFTVQATDANGNTGSQAYTWTVNPPALSLSPADGSTFNATYGQTFSQTFTASGGNAPYTYFAIGALPTGLVWHASTQTISGTPTVSGSFPVQIQVADSSTGTGAPFHASYNYVIQIVGPIITLTPASLADGTVGSAYSQTLIATGGVGPYTFAITGGGLPAGLTLDQDGSLSGTPTAAGSFPVTVTATDAHGQTGAQVYTLTIGAPTVVLSPATLPAPVLNVAYNHRVSATGGIAPYTYAISAGSLPAGLNFDTATGAISGAPTTAGAYSFTVKATDSSTGTGAPFSASQTYSGTISAPTITLSPTTLAPATVGAATSQTITAAGGAGAYTYAISAGNLPAGVHLESSGHLSGTPTAAGTFTFTVRATDANTNTGTQAYTWTVNAPALTLTPTAGTLNADYNQTYTQTFAAGGGTGPYVYTLTGALPAGMNFDAATGVLSGTATQTGSFPITVKAVDSTTGTGPFNVSRNYTLTVAAPTISLTPASLPGGAVASAYNASLDASGGVGPYTYAVSSGALPAGVHLQPSGHLTGTPTAAGTFQLTVTATDAHSQTGSHNYTLQVSGPTLSLAPGTLPAATAESAYNQPLAASGGTAPYSYAITAGNLPTGVSLDAATGVMSGTPTVAGSFPVTITATDSSSGAGAPFSVAHNYTLTVAGVTIALTPTHLPAMQAGVAYSQQLTASGGDGHYTFTVSAGSLPSGLTLSSAGLLSGTPSTAGPASFTVTATDSLNFSGAQAYAVTVGQPVPVAADDSVSTPANQAVTINVTANDSGPFTSVTVATPPTHGSTTVNGLKVVYTPTHDYYGNDSFTYTVTGPGGTSAAATVKIKVTPLAVPVATAQKASVLAGKTVTFDATQGASGGPFTVAAVTAAPAFGTATASGTTISYTAPVDASGKVTFEYTLSNHFGTSKPVRVTVTVNPMPVAPSLTAKVLAGTSVQVDLTDKAHGGPFTGATVVSIKPTAAGTASIKAANGGYTLSFRAAGNFSGQAHLTYTLSNAWATSAPGTIDITVTARPDPSKDPEVLGILVAQANAARRLARGQIDNFQQRLESLNDGGGDHASFSNGLSLSVTDAFRPLERNQQHMDNMQRTGDGPSANSNWFDAYLDHRAPRQPRTGAKQGEQHRLPGAWSIWTSGAVAFGHNTPGTDVGGLDFTTSGITLGADRKLGKAFAFGGGIGYGHDLTDVGHNGSRSKADSYNVGVYASYHPHGHFYVDGLAGYQWLSFTSRRYLTANGGRVYGKRDGKQWFGSVSAGYEHRAKSLLLVPYVRLDAAHARLDGYTERGDDVYALTYGEQTVNTTTGSVGLRLQWSIKRDYGIWAPSLRVEYQHDFQGSSTVALRYADLLQGPVYQAEVPQLANNHALLGAGVGLQTLKGWSLRFTYRNLIDSTSHANQSVLLHASKSFP